MQIRPLQESCGLLLLFFYFVCLRFLKTFFKKKSFYIYILYITKSWSGIFIVANPPVSHINVAFQSTLVHSGHIRSTSVQFNPLRFCSVHLGLFGPIRSTWSIRTSLVHLVLKYKMKKLKLLQNNIFFGMWFLLI